MLRKENREPPGNPRPFPTESQGPNGACAQTEGTATLPASSALALSSPMLCPGAAMGLEDQQGEARSLPALPSHVRLACARGRLGQEAVSHHAGCLDGLGPPLTAVFACVLP